jgi:hypothetical protein
MDETGVKKRVRVSINKVVHDRNLSNKALAKLFNSTATTVSNYRTMRNIPKAAFISMFCDLFQCNQQWIMTGQGRPFLDSAESNDEMFSKYWEIPSITKQHVETMPFKHTQPDLPTDEFVSLPQPTARSGAPFNEPPGAQFRMTDALTMCARVLESETSYATALYLNIQHFDRAVSAEERIGQLEAHQVAFEQATQVRFREMEIRMDTLVKRNDELITETKSKQTEINRLKATYEDPDGCDGCLTNTSEKK